MACALIDHDCCRFSSDTRLSSNPLGSCATGGKESHWQFLFAVMLLLPIPCRHLRVASSHVAVHL